MARDRRDLTTRQNTERNSSTAKMTSKHGSWGFIASQDDDKKDDKKGGKKGGKK